jgi:hypothetical protein
VVKESTIHVLVRHTADNEGADAPRTWAACSTTGRSDELQELARQLHDREEEVLLRDMEVGGCDGSPMGRMPGYPPHQAAVSKDKGGDAVKKRKARDVLRGTGDTARIQRREGGRSVEQGLSSKDAMDKVEELADVGGVAPEAGHGADSRAGARAAGAEADEKEAAAGAAGGGEGSRPCKTLPRMDPEEALRAFAESVGMPVKWMWRKVTRGDGGEIVEIDWYNEDLKGTLPVGDLNMPYLRTLYLDGNRELKGEARGVGVTVVKFTDCFCE